MMHKRLMKQLDDLGTEFGPASVLRAMEVQWPGTTRDFIRAGIKEPMLGLATNGQMLDELNARFQVGNIHPGYSTVHGDPTDDGHPENTNMESVYEAEVEEDESPFCLEQQQRLEALYHAKDLLENSQHVDDDELINIADWIMKGCPNAR